MEYYGTSFWAPTNTLAHHGIKGMKWGVRRYQNEDGSLTAAGRRRYGTDLDITDKRRTNIAKIRLGEARRRLDVAKKNNNGTNYTRIADLKARERSAKRALGNARMIDRGAKRAAKGETILGNQAKSFLVGAGARYASTLLPHLLNKRLATLYANGQYVAGHRWLAGNINKYGQYAILGGAAAYMVKKSIDNAAIRSYYSDKAHGTSSITNIGSAEYKDVVKRRKEGN